MKALFNKIFTAHNIHSEAEGAYRIKDYNEFPDIDFNGEEYVTLIHTEKYRQFIKSACENNDFVAEVSLSPESYESACQAVGLTIMASEQRDIAVVRPPGHHATAERSAGFCFFNNIAIATQKLVNEGKRVFIFDIDGHHGDGTQSIFYNWTRFTIAPFTSIMLTPLPDFLRREEKMKVLDIPLTSRYLKVVVIRSSLLPRIRLFQKPGSLIQM